MPAVGPKLIEKAEHQNPCLIDSAVKKRLREAKVSFSFRYFKHDIKYFGLGDCTAKWHLGLLQRLATLSAMSQDEILRENAGNEALRCHVIEFGAKNCPMKRSDFTWLPKAIRENENDFKFMQISISLSTGRIIGFFDANPNIFHIVLLDPKHNMQPSKDYGYKVDATTTGTSQYDELLGRMSQLKKQTEKCATVPCPLSAQLDHLDTLHSNIVYFGLDDDFYQAYQAQIQTHSISEIVEAGLFALLPTTKEE